MKFNGVWVRNKKCPKCQGNTFLEKDEFDNWIRKCLLCSYETDLDGNRIVSPYVQNPHGGNIAGH